MEVTVGGRTSWSARSVGFMQSVPGFCVTKRLGCSSEVKGGSSFRSGDDVGGEREVKSVDHVSPLRHAVIGFTQRPVLENSSERHRNLKFTFFKYGYFIGVRLFTYTALIVTPIQLDVKCLRAP